jgi:hypothetical protein
MSITDKEYKKKHDEVTIKNKFIDININGEEISNFHEIFENIENSLKPKPSASGDLSNIYVINILKTIIICIYNFVYYELFNIMERDSKNELGNELKENIINDINEILSVMNNKQMFKNLAKADLFFDHVILIIEKVIKHRLGKKESFSKDIQDYYHIMYPMFSDQNSELEGEYKTNMVKLLQKGLFNEIDIIIKSILSYLFNIESVTGAAFIKFLDSTTKKLEFTTSVLTESLGTVIKNKQEYITSVEAPSSGTRLKTDDEDDSSGRRLKTDDDDDEGKDEDEDSRKYIKYKSKYLKLKNNFI